MSGTKIGRRPENRSARSAFTLVELLVVIAIIGVLIAMLLPAVQAAREAARRMSCTNNLKQIALALHNYHDLHKTFPQGYMVQGKMTEAWGWTVFVLPFLEQKPLYDKLDVNNRRLTDFLDDGTDIALLQTPLSDFRCPSDTTEDLLPYDLRHFKGVTWAKHPDFKPATSNYMGDRGMFDKPGAFKNDGVFFGNSRVSFASISDGTSNTFLVGERDERCAAGTWIGARNPPGPDMWSVFFMLGRVSIKLNDPRNRNPSTGQRSNTCTEGFSSMHPGGAFFAFCDGSVHFINEDIEFDNAGLTTIDHFTRPQNFPSNYPNTNADLADFGTYQLLGIRADGQPMQGF